MTDTQAFLKDYVLTVAGKKYAASLFWQVASGTTKGQVQKEALDFLKKVPEPHNVICLKERGVRQYGVGSEAHKYTRGLAAAAETVATNVSRGKSLLAAWAMDGKVWLCILKKDTIYPTGDRIYDDEAEARAVFEQHSLSDQWDILIAPDPWKIEGAEEIPIQEFFGTPGKARLVFPDSLKRWKYVAGIAVLAGGAMAGAYFYHNMIQTSLRLEEMRLLSQMAARKAPKKGPEAASWKYLPNNADTHNQCVYNIQGFIKGRIPGWQVSKVTCDVLETNVTSVWTRQGGTARLFEHFANKVPHGELIFGGNGQTATLKKSWKFKENVVKANPPTLSEREIEIHLWTLRQRTEINLSLHKGVIKDAAVKVPSGVSVKKGKGVGFKLTTKFSPATVFNSLYKMPGSVIYDIEYSPGSQQWAVSGFIHQK